jgi:hypothetical protein
LNDDLSSKQLRGGCVKRGAVRASALVNSCEHPSRVKGATGCEVSLALAMQKVVGQSRVIGFDESPAQAGFCASTT